MAQYVRKVTDGGPVIFFQISVKLGHFCTVDRKNGVVYNATVG